MKKYIGVLWFCMAVVTSAQADTTIPWTKEGCESVKGTWITAHSATDSGCDAAHCNGKNFCTNKVKVNWWSALIWCKSIGHKLTDIETACPHGLASSSSCANLNGKISWRYWTNTPCSTESQYCAQSGGSITCSTYDKRSAVDGYALCEE